MKSILKFILSIFCCLNVLPTAIISSSAKQSRLNQLPLFPFRPASDESLSAVAATLPTMVIQAWKTSWNNDSTLSLERLTRAISGVGNDPIEIHRHDDTSGDDDGHLKITCFAPYPLVIQTNIIAKEIRQSYEVSDDASNWTLVIKFSFPSAGYVSCSRLNNHKPHEQLETTVGIYFDSVMDDDDLCSHCGAFVQPRHSDVIPLGESRDGKSKRYLAPCRLNIWFDPYTRDPVKPRLLLEGKEVSENETTWNPAEGYRFTLLANNIQGRVEEGHEGSGSMSAESEQVASVECVLEGEHLAMGLPKILENVSFPTVKAEGDQIRIPHRALRGYDEGASYEQGIELWVQFCQWLSSCPLRLQEVKRQAFRLGTGSTKPRVAQGILTLSSLPVSLPLDYNFAKFFTGLDRKIYLIPGNVQAPDEALIQLVGVPQHQIDKHNTPILNLTCRVVNFVIAPRVYLKAVNQNGSSTLLTIGDTLVDDESGQRNGISEFRFEVELDAGMSTVECLGLELYGSDATGGKWRKSGGARINVTYSYAPTVRPGTPKTGDKKCLSEGSCLLDCPIVGVPPPEISWVVPGETRLTKTGNPLHLDKIIGNSAIVPGIYTCFASSPTGQANYTYTVTLEESSLRTGSKIGIAVVVIILMLLTVTFAWQYHRTKKLLGGLTPKQIQEFLKGNQETANLSEDGTERARLMEFAKFISPQLLHINMSEKLGEGCYGVVYGGSYDSQPAAIKTFKMGITNEQLYSILVEIKLMAFIGDHENIVKFFGADISRLRGGQMYMVMERSTGGNLESYLRKELRNKFTIIKQSKSFAPEVDDLLKTLIQLCSDIASAMEFLEAKKIIHGDLATRNVLLFGENTARTVAKLTDFGYSRRLNCSLQYTSRSFGTILLPWAWASPELLTTGTYSTASDVWAFGVALWEIFSLGRVPFQGCAFNEEFIDGLQKGQRLPRPEVASDHIFGVLLSCWSVHQSDRPSFNQLRDHLAGLKLTHKQVSSLFTCAQNSMEEGRQDLVEGNSSGGVAVYANGNVYL